jgi:FlaA1/EpsC-like NDP-sugar epimerase
MQDVFMSKTVLITGAAGTIGRELMRQLLEDQSVARVIGIDNNESELFFLEQTFSKFPQAFFYLADVRDRNKTANLMQAVDAVFHTAAFKHVIMCERSPMEAVKNNILGTQNIIDGAIENGVKLVIFTSSDKAVNPTNVMGTSKLMAERLISAANSKLKGNGPIFASTRFGNVLGSRGSVIPIFRQQIRRGGPVTITDIQMTRFIMSIREAIQLVLGSATLACGGEVFVTKMPAIRIQDLAEVMIEELAPKFGINPKRIEIKRIGIKPGEKIYEELMNDEETRRTIELRQFFAVIPAFGCAFRNIEYIYPEILSDHVADAYNSNKQTPLLKAQIRELLLRNCLLGTNLGDENHPAERFWPDR